MSARATEAIPRVSGRHRNRALASYRRARAIELRARGLTYQQVADELGYANKGSVYSIVQKGLADREADGVDELRFVEQQRLDALQSAVWERAMEGHVPSVEAALGILKARMRLLGLMGGSEARPCTQPQTVLLQENDCRLRGCAHHT